MTNEVRRVIAESARHHHITMSNTELDFVSDWVRKMQGDNTWTEAYLIKWLDTAWFHGPLRFQRGTE